jgi:hypothetical protein
MQELPNRAEDEKVYQQTRLHLLTQNINVCSNYLFHVSLDSRLHVLHSHLSNHLTRASISRWLLSKGTFRSLSFSLCPLHASVSSFIEYTLNLFPCTSLLILSKSVHVFTPRNNFIFAPANFLTVLLTTAQVPLSQAHKNRDTYFTQPYFRFFPYILS